MENTSKQFAITVSVPFEGIEPSTQEINARLERVVMSLGWAVNIEPMRSGNFAEFPCVLLDPK